MLLTEEQLKAQLKDKFKYWRWVRHNTRNNPVRQQMAVAHVEAYREVLELIFGPINREGTPLADVKKKETNGNQ